MAQRRTHTIRDRSSTRRASNAPAVAPDSRGRSSRRWWRDDRTRFVVAFVVLAGGLLAFYYFPRTDEEAVERLTAAYLHVYTRMAAWPIGLFDPLASAHGDLVVGRFSMRIVKSCDAMEANILFAAALLAFSAPLWRKGVAFVVGLAALVGVNLVRLFFLYWIGVFAPSTFDFFHLDVWPLLMVAFAALDFVLCVRWACGFNVVAALGGEGDGRVAG